jgi:hypothetical protein
MVGTPAKEYPQFEAALSLLPALPPEDAQALLEERCTRLELMLIHQRGMHQILEKQQIPELFGLETDFSITLLEAELEWVQRLRTRIESGELGGIDGWRQFLAEQGERLST